jgi:hypothetical protein
MGVFNRNIVDDTYNETDVALPAADGKVTALQLTWVTWIQLGKITNYLSVFRR